MVYVFGMEGVPLFEILFIVSTLMLAGLILILQEIRKLRKLITEEKVDIKRFEADLQEFEFDEKKQPSSGLIYHIQNAMSKGMTKDQIENSLLQRGWSRENVEKIFRNLRK